MGLERYSEAIECFRKVLSQPVQLVHQVHINAYERITLLNLVVHGRAFEPKKAGIGHIVLKAIDKEEQQRLRTAELEHQDGLWAGDEDFGGNALVVENARKWHHDLLSAWETNLPAKMEEAIATNFEALEKEQLVGMARLLLKSLIQKKIRDLSATYLTLSFEEIAAKTKLPANSLESSLTEMVWKRAITAKINKKQGTVDFIESEGEADDDQLVSQSTFATIKTVEAQNARIVKLLSRVKDANEKIRHTDDYITQKARKSMQNQGNADEDMADDD